MPERVVYVEPARRRMRVEHGGRVVARSDEAVLLFEPARSPVGHAADPYHRVDIRRTSRHLVVRDDPRADVAAEALAPVASCYDAGSSHGPDRNLSVDEVGGIQLVDA